MNYSQSYLSRDESNIIKGILILLVVIGHNGILMGKAPGLTTTTFNNYIYEFHVYSFFILPFLYNFKDFSLSRIKKNVTHLYKPYTMAFFLLACFNIISTKEINILSIISAYISGNEPLLKEGVGASFLWFIPTMCLLLFLRDFAIGSTNKIITISAISFTLLLLVRLHILPYYPIYKYTVLGIYPALIYFSAGIIIRYIISNTYNKKYWLYIFISFGIISSIVYFKTYPNNNYIWQINNHLIILFAMFLTIYSISKMGEKSIYLTPIKYLGQNSLPIYIFHVFIYNITQKICIAYNIPLSPISGISTLIVTIAISLLLITTLNKTKFYRYIFQ